MYIWGGTTLRANTRRFEYDDLINGSDIAVRTRRGRSRTSATRGRSTCTRGTCTCTSRAGHGEAAGVLQPTTVLYVPTPGGSAAKISVGDVQGRGRYRELTFGEQGLLLVRAQIPLKLAASSPNMQKSSPAAGFWAKCRVPALTFLQFPGSATNITIPRKVLLGKQASPAPRWT